MPIRVALRERNIENAESYILDVADPRSPNFGKADLDWHDLCRSGQQCRNGPAPDKRANNVPVASF